MSKWIVAIAAFSFSATALSGIDRATLAGRVTDTSGKPLEHVTVLIYHAGVKKGYSTFCPSCYTDCGKRAMTDARGAFTITGLSRDLWFELLFVRAGYTPTFVSRVDPLEGPAPTAVLATRAAADDPARTVHGRVVDGHGTPVRDAVVTPEGILVTRDRSSIYGAAAGLDPVAVTDEEGDFEIAYSEPVSKMALMVEPRAMAPKFVVLPTGAERQTVTVFDGAVIRGRLVRDGKPVSGAEIGLSPREAWFGMANLSVSGSFYDEVRIGTREDGTFAITNVPAPEQWNLYGKMESIASRGATDPITFATTNDSQEVNVGDIEIKHGYHLRGKVGLSDGRQIPEGMRISIVSDRSRDAQTTLLSTDGKFEFVGLAAGSYSIIPSVKGYGLPKNRPNVQPSVEHDMDDFKLILDPEGGNSTHP